MPLRNDTIHMGGMNMDKPAETTFRCPVCHLQKPETELVPSDFIHGGLVDLIKEKHPDYFESKGMCDSCLNDLRSTYIEKILEESKGELTELDDEVVKSLKEHELVSRNVNDEFSQDLTFGQRLSDKLAAFGGSWVFIIFFGIVLCVWITINTIGLMSRPFDPYPYILLNLVLSCLAAIQAPVIMMSQNRQESKDRLRSEHDYRVNLKAELEIRHLNTKMDQLLHHQWARLMEIQRVQMEMMDQLARKQNAGGS
jgi:uncharacterized membrane protein